MSEQSNKRSIRNILSMGLFVVMLALLGWYVWQNRQDMAQMLNLSWQTVAGMLLLALGGCIINAVYHLIILQTYEMPLSLVDWMGVVSVSNVIAYVLPLRADLVFSAAYYKKVKGLAYTKSVSMAAGNIVFGIAFSLLEMLAALLCIGFLDGSWPGLLWLLWLLGTAGIAVVIAVALLFEGRLPAFLQKYPLIVNVMEGFTALLRNKRMLWKLLACLIANHTLQLLLHMLCFRAIGSPVTFYLALFYNSVSWISGIVAIVPGNIGIKESVLGAAAMLLGTLFQSGVAVSLLQRVAMLIMHLIMGLVFAWPVYRRIVGKNKEAME